ncbi:phosphatase PAP2 family protein [Streptomyces mexicanus]|uniref:phosphatase PAP2 family protein n=1 Tax=Streptomyces mexicanus TaxID=178566 RepID=UPI003651F589
MRRASATPPSAAPGLSRPPGPRSAAGRAAWVLAACSVVLLVLVAVRWAPLMAFDDTVARACHRWAVAEHGTTRVLRVLTDWVWDPLTMRLVCVAVALGLAARPSARWTAVWLTAACTVALLLQHGLKAAVDRPRPVWPDPVDSARQAAFPSGHAMTATVVCGLLLWLLHRHGVGRALWSTALVLAAVCVLGVGVTRVWLGVHWPSDVVGGWLLGGTVVAVAAAVHQRWSAPERGPVRESWSPQAP